MPVSSAATPVGGKKERSRSSSNKVYFHSDLLVKDFEYRKFGPLPRTGPLPFGTGSKTWKSNKRKRTGLHMRSPRSPSDFSNDSPKNSHCFFLINWLLSSHGQKDNVLFAVSGPMRPAYQPRFSIYPPMEVDPYGKTTYIPTYIIYGDWLLFRPCFGGSRTRSVLVCIPTQSVGTRN